jgi:hypothetical protein
VTKPFLPLIRVISVDPDRTRAAEKRLLNALERHELRQYPVRSVFCHLEAGRCGIPAGLVAVEVDGRVIWAGKDLTDALAESFAAGLPAFVRQLEEESGLR